MYHLIADSALLMNLSECGKEICYVSLHILGCLVYNVGGGDDQLGGVVEVPVPGPPVLGHAQHGGSEILTKNKISTFLGDCYVLVLH